MMANLNFIIFMHWAAFTLILYPSAMFKYSRSEEVRVNVGYWERRQTLVVPRMSFGKTRLI